VQLIRAAWAVITPHDSQRNCTMAVAGTAETFESTHTAPVSESMPTLSQHRSSFSRRIWTQCSEYIVVSCLLVSSNRKIYQLCRSCFSTDRPKQVIPPHVTRRLKSSDNISTHAPRLSLTYPAIPVSLLKVPDALFPGLLLVL
jgi:hypothetical protein